jgi:hypothetical protein
MAVASLPTANEPRRTRTSAVAASSAESDLAGEADIGLPVSPPPDISPPTVPFIAKLLRRRTEAVVGRMPAGGIGLVGDENESALSRFRP